MLQLEMNALKVENWRLKEDRPQQTKTVQTDQELAQMQREKCGFGEGTLPAKRAVQTVAVRNPGG